MALFCTYLLPFRRSSFQEEEVGELARYLERLAVSGGEVLVVDGSPAPIFEQHHAVLVSTCRHVPVDRRFGFLNDKVNGIYTGVGLASSEKIILADDDVRYTAAGLNKMAALLDGCEMARPQNFLWPLPWWAALEAARMLINRAVLPAADYPGTCGFRRQSFQRAGRYDGDVLFDNEEIIRHFAQQRCTIVYANDFFVQKRPPTLRKWMEQRPRQAYEDFGMRMKTALFFSLLPLLLLTALFFRARGLFGLTAAISAGAILLALRGWMRGRARAFVPLRCCLCAPLWVAERTLSTWWALSFYLRHGGYPFGDRILSKGVGRAWRSGGRLASAQCARP